MPNRRIKFTFPHPLVTEPVIYELGKKFPVVTNIRRADVREKFGWVILELTGEEADIERSLEWVRSKGVRVDPASGDVVEG
ncbi:MAG: FeS-binding protein [Dehalococcoidia bacterium]|nr:FeS-binding protein [Dehalococcoidia bacterium]